MIDKIRYATPEEIETIAKGSDLGPGCTVITFGGKEFAVVRTVVEIDPVIFAEDTSNSRKLYFTQALETFLRLTGVPAYYANVHVSDEKWIDTMEKAGAERTSTEPEYRMKKVL